MKLLLVNPNNVKPPVMPLGILYLQTYLNDKGIEVHILDLNNQEDIFGAIDKSIISYKIDLIGFTIRNYDNVMFDNYEKYIYDILSMINKVKRKYNKQIVLGGAGYSIFPKEILEMCDADFGVSGEGEKGLHKLILYLDEKLEDINVIENLFYKDKGVVKNTFYKNMCNNELDEIKCIDMSKIDYKYYYENGGVCSIQSKRGCALECIYCTYPIVEGKEFRLFDYKRVVDEMELNKKKYGMDYFYFVDSIFNIPNTHALNICNEIIHRDLKIKWFGYLSPKNIEESVDIYLKSGMDGVWFSIDTCSLKMLYTMKKGVNKSEVERSFNYCNENNIPFNVVLLVGGPGENEETLNETFDVLDKYKPNIVLIHYGIRIYPNTELQEIAVENGMIYSKNNLLDYTFYELDKMQVKLIDMIRKKCDSTYNWNHSLAPKRRDRIKGLFVENEVNKLRKEGENGPYWVLYDKYIKRKSDLNE